MRRRVRARLVRGWGISLCLATCVAPLATGCSEGVDGDAETDFGEAPTVGIEFRGGLWYTESGFDDRVYYAVRGQLSRTPPDSVLRIVDLQGGYVIPPFGDAHNHRPEGWPGTEGHIAQFLEEGIFYVLNPNSFPSMTEPIAEEINHPESVDVIFANGGLTPPGSHVVELYERNFDAGIFPDDWTRDRLDGEGYHVIRNRRDLEARWPSVIDGGPDIIKAFMGFSEDYEARRDNPDFVGMRGLDPTLIPEIVERAHAEGLRVAAHIETAEDFRVAVSAGVDVVAHMPASWRIGEAAGYSDNSIERWMLEEADAAAAAHSGVIVVAHVFNGFLNPLIERIHRHNLELLERHGVTLAIGSDNYRQTALREAVYLQSTGLFTAEEVLRIASRNTAQAIFPDRRIGVLDEGYEASFLVIENDPIAQPLFAASEGDPMQGVRQAVERIRLRVKQGRILDELDRPATVPG